jgi:site-specific recombinase XerD
LTAKHYSKRTIEQYSSILKMFLSDFNEYPRDITANQITEWIASKGNASTMGQYRGALKNYYDHVVGQSNKFKKIPYPKKENRVPQIMSQEVVIERINSIDNLKHRMVVSVLYGAGIRLSELLDLRITDIDGDRNTLFIRHGKGGKDRVVPVSSKLIQDLRIYFKQYRPTSYLFEGQFGGIYSSTSVQNICRKYMKCNPHLLRHCNLTHLVESGVDISEVSKRAGHAKLETTMVYNHIATTFNPITLLAA